jgi:hypothetical protein
LIWYFIIVVEVSVVPQNFALLLVAMLLLLLLVVCPCDDWSILSVREVLLDAGLLFCGSSCWCCEGGLLKSASALVLYCFRNAVFISSSPTFIRWLVLSTGIYHSKWQAQTFPRSSMGL